MLRPACRTAPDLNHISEELWKRARERYAAIQPLLADKPVSRETAKECAQAAGVHVSTLYRWLAAYRATGQLTALLPEAPGVHTGQTRLDAGSGHNPAIFYSNVLHAILINS